MMVKENTKLKAGILPSEERAEMPVIDLHCDLLSYLTYYNGATPYREDEIGCAYPFLLRGGVRLQVMAIYTAVEPDSVNDAYRQSEAYVELLDEDDSPFVHVDSAEKLDQLLDVNSTKIGVMVAIESASGFCNETEPIEDAFENLEALMANTGKPFYISLTHHDLNRFGGGNYSKYGLRRDGETLLKYLHGKKIAVDLSHTSDALAHDILKYIDKHQLEIPILASHSNFRSIWKHNRNLTDELVKEVIKRQGLIGINFLRSFIDNDHPEALLRHILYAFEKGADKNICFGADFFCVKHDAIPERIPYYFFAHENAGKYPSILKELEKEGLTRQQLEDLSYRNAMNFMKRNGIV
ncbi:MAG: membrane dipeptidase [Flammeovirgaceae bacterium]|nr:membrane dipeptidase [Flammeovirgaceae bacterium]